MTVPGPNLPVLLLQSVEVSSERGSSFVIDELGDEWRDLCSRSQNEEPFFRPEWIGAYLRAFEPAAKMLVTTVRRQRRLHLVLPLIEEKATLGGVPVRRLRSPANSHPGRFDLVCLPDADGESAIRLAWQHLKKREHWDLLELRNVPEGGVCDRLVALARADGLATVTAPTRPNPCVFLPGSTEGLGALPRNARLRTKLRQARRELGTDLRFHCVEAPKREALERFFELEQSGWKGEQKSAIKSASHTLNFYIEIADSAGRFGYFSLYLLEWKGQLLAGHFSLRHRGRCYSPKVAYSETFDRFVPGHLIVQEILRDCSERGVRAFDITGPDDDWKLKWTSDVRRMNDHYIFKGKLGALAHTVRFGIRPKLVRVFRRLGKT